MFECESREQGRVCIQVSQSGERGWMGASRVDESCQIQSKLSKYGRQNFLAIWGRAASWNGFKKFENAFFLIFSDKLPLIVDKILWKFRMKKIRKFSETFVFYQENFDNAVNFKDFPDF